MNRDSHSWGYAFDRLEEITTLYFKNHPIRIVRLPPNENIISYQGKKLVIIKDIADIFNIGSGTWMSNDYGDASYVESYINWLQEQSFLDKSRFEFGIWWDEVKQILNDETRNVLK